VIGNGFGNGVKNVKGAKPFLKADLKSYDIRKKKILILTTFSLGLNSRGNSFKMEKEKD
jgi:hypothetical protein